MYYYPIPNDCNAAFPFLELPIPVIKTHLQHSLLKDCITYPGLHRLINLDILDYKFKLVFKGLFTDYKKEWIKDKEVLTCISQFLPDLAESLALNNLFYVKPPLANRLSEFILFKVSHLELINKIITDNLDPELHSNFIANLPYTSKSYPYLDYKYYITPHSIAYMSTLKNTEEDVA